MNNETLKEQQSLKSLELSSSKNNKLFVVFYLLVVYIFVSVLGTTDKMLLLPTDTFKMPLIGFDLNIIYFYVLAPLILLILHFNLLFHHHEHLKRLDAYKGEFVIETVDSSMYNYVYISLKNGSKKGSAMRVLLWMLIYLFPLLVLVSIFQRFADYHHELITSLHLLIIWIDIILICTYIYVNAVYFRPTWFNTFFAGLILLVGVLESSFFIYFFYPLVKSSESFIPVTNYEKMDSYAKLVCNVHYLFLESQGNRAQRCYPRIIVRDEKISKISPSTLYIPRYIVKEENTKILEEREREKRLILEYGERIDLANRNLRYADLENCILTRADMHNTQLQGGNLKKTHLQAVKLDNAKLQGVDMMSAKLQGAMVLGAQMQGALLIAADMSDAYFDESNLSKARMMGADLKNTSFYKSNLSGVNMSGVKNRTTKK